MTRFPPRIKIGKHEYRIVVTHDLSDRLAGLCFLDDKVILVSAKQDKWEMAATLFHEVLHAIEEEYRVVLGHPKIRRLEWALAQVFSQLQAPPPRRRRSKNPASRRGRSGR